MFNRKFVYRVTVAIVDFVTMSKSFITSVLKCKAQQNLKAHPLLCIPITLKNNPVIIFN